MKRLLLSFFYLLTSCIELSAQQFSNLYYDNRLLATFRSICEKDNNFYTTGITAAVDSPHYYKALFSKVNEDGNLAYIKGVNDTLPFAYFLWNNNMRRTDDGNFLACGTMTDTMEKSFIAKFDTLGNLVFYKSYRDTTLNLFHAEDVLELSGKGYLIIFNSNYPGTLNNDIIVYRTDTLGNVINATVQYAGLTEHPNLIRPMLNGNFMIGANSQPNDGYYSKTFMIEVDSMGNNVRQWVDNNTENLWPLGMQQTSDSGWIVTRMHIAYNQNGIRAYNASVIKFDKDFLKVWEFFRGDTGFDTGLYDIEVLPDGKYIACGITPTWGHDSAYQWGWIVKIDTDGTVLWDRKYLSLARFGTYNFLYDIDVLPNGDLLACGELQFRYDLGIRPIQQGWVLRTDSNGCEIENCLMGIDESQPLNNLKMQAFPNPFSSSISLSLQKENLQQADLTITDVMGSTVFKSAIHIGSAETQFEINLSYLPAGVYILQLIANGERSVRQLVKQ